MKKRNWFVVGLLTAVGSGFTGGGCSFPDPLARPADAGPVDGTSPPVTDSQATTDVNAPDVLDGAKGDERDAPKPTPDAACAPVDGKRCAAGNRAVETCGSSGAWVAEACPGAFPVCKANLCVEECTPGTKRCQADTVQTCQPDSTWGAAVACAAPKPSCNPGGECGTGIICPAGGTRCNGNSVETCGAGGDSWSAAVPCPSATPACGPVGRQVDGVCGTIECTPGELGCTGNSTRSCQADSRWGAATTCPASTPVCSGNGVCGIDDCTPGNKKCLGNSVLTCPPSSKWPATGPACPAATPACGAIANQPDGTCGIIECTPGAKECVGAGSRTCQADSRWGAVLPCGAATPLCVAATGLCVACAAGDVSCRDGRTPQTCNMGAWTPSAACNVGSECKPATSACGLCTGTVVANDWTQVATIGGPPPGRSHGRMAHDPSDGSMILFGGRTGGSTVTNDTWRLTGAVWTALNPAIKPSARQNHAMATNTTNGKVYLFGGATVAGVANDELWEWNGSTWTQRCATAPCSANRPSARTAAGLAYDSDRDRLVLVGGLASGNTANDTWEWDGAAWTQKCGGALPSCGFAPMHELFGGAAYDSLRKRTAFLITDITNGGAASRLYEYDGVRWALGIGNANPPFPGGSYGAAMANVYDPLRKVLVSLGHPSESDFRIWEWNGACWSNTSPSSASHGTRGQATAWDPTNSRIVRMGGIENGVTYHNVVWERSSL